MTMMALNLNSIILTVVQYTEIQHNLKWAQRRASKVKRALIDATRQLGNVWVLHYFLVVVLDTIPTELSMQLLCFLKDNVASAQTHYIISRACWMQRRARDE
jgi:hypothetical protein